MKREEKIIKKRSIIINFIKKNPTATYKLIRKETRLHPERIFNSLEEAFKEASVKLPRTFKFKTKDERRKIIIDYIREHPRAGGQVIAKETKINILSAFKSIKEAFDVAGVNYPRRIDKRERSEKISEIVNLIRANPNISVDKIMKETRTNFYKFFRNMNEVYGKAQINPIQGNEKRVLKKRTRVINFIKNNPLATQREINHACNTHVQRIFDKGIFEAYERAGIDFPYERLKLYGVGLKSIRDRAKSFEEEIATKLSGYGKVNRLVKTKRGFADIIFERNENKAIIEVKNYLSKEISISQVNQLNKYLEDCKCTLGILVCNKKPKKDNFLMGKNKIIILEDSELNRLPELVDKDL
jgi:hypothetical protein